MHKLWLIIQREYLTRVKKRSFILATLLTPLAFLVFFVVLGFIMSYKEGNARHITIVDPSNMLRKSIKDDNNIFFHFSDESIETAKNSFDSEKSDGILYIPELKDLQTKKLTVYFYTKDRLGLDTRSLIEDQVEDRVRNYKIETLHLDKEQLAALDTKVTLDPEPLGEDSEEKNVSSLTDAIAAGLGSILGIILYMTIVIYGSMVMRSVMEEKTSRIVEVMISSVRPTQLMQGKVIGVGAVGLTQLAIWTVLVFVIQLGVQLFFGFDFSQARAMQGAAQAPVDPDDLRVMMGKIMSEVYTIPWSLIIPLFIFFFISGYLLYSSMFAAVGSAMGDDLGEGQALTIPITIPIILAFYIMFVTVRAPHSNLAVWSSIFPLFAPIVMPARLAFGPPAWQIGLSIVLMLGATYFFVWLSGRIYRVGILLYGKKVNLREMVKWIFYRE